MLRLQETFSKTDKKLCESLLIVLSYNSYNSDYGVTSGYTDDRGYEEEGKRGKKSKRKKEKKNKVCHEHQSWLFFLSTLCTF